MKKHFRKILSLFVVLSTIIIGAFFTTNIVSNSKTNNEAYTIENYANGVVTSASPTTVANTSATVTYAYTIATSGGSDNVTYILYAGTSEAGTVKESGTTPQNEITSSNYTISFINLSPNTNYFLEFYVGGVLQTGAVVSFKTTQNPSAVVSSASSSNITNTSADIQYQYDYIDSSGETNVTYNLYEGTTTTTPPVQSGNTPANENNTSGSYTLSLTNLKPNQDYVVVFLVGTKAQESAVVKFKTTNNFDGKVTITGSSAFDNNSGVVSYSYTKATGTGSNNVTYTVHQGTDNTGPVVGTPNTVTPPDEVNAVTSLNFKITGLTNNTTYTIEFFVNGVTQGTTTFTTSNNVDGLVGLINPTPQADNTSVVIQYRYTMATGTGVDTVKYTLYEGSDSSGQVVTGHNNVDTPNTEVGGDSNQFTITGLEANTQYYIEFRVNGTLQGGKSFTTQNNFDGRVTMVSPRAGVDNTSIVVAYDYVQATGTGTNDVKYSIYEGSDATGTPVTGHVNMSTTADESTVGTGHYEFTVSGLKPDTRYYVEFYVNGVFQGSQLVRTTNNFNAEVSAISTSTTNNTATINYNFKVATGTGSNDLRYTLYLGNSATAGNEVAGYINVMTPVTEVVGSNSFTLTSLTPNTTYYIDFEINNISIAGTSFTTTNNFDAVVTNLDVITNQNNTSAQVNYYYEAALGTGSSNVTYTLREGTDATGTIVNGYNNIATTPSETTSGNYTFELTNLKPNTDYYIEFKVNGVVNDTYAFKTQNNYDAVITNSTVTSFTDTSATISYRYTQPTGTGSNDVSYELWQGNKTSGTLLKSETTPNNEVYTGDFEMTLIGLTENTEYTVVFYVNGVYEEEVSFKTFMTVDDKEMITSYIVRYDGHMALVQITCSRIDLSQKVDYKVNNGEWKTANLIATDQPNTYQVWVDLTGVDGYFGVSWRINNITQDHVTVGSFIPPVVVPETPVVKEGWPLWLTITIALSSVIFLLLLAILAMWLYYHYIKNRKDKHNKNTKELATATVASSNVSTQTNTNKTKSSLTNKEKIVVTKVDEYKNVPTAYDSLISKNTSVSTYTAMTGATALATVEEYKSENRHSKVSKLKVVQRGTYEVVVSFEYESHLEHYPWVTYTVYEGVNKYGRPVVNMKDVNVKVANAHQRWKYEFTLKNLKAAQFHFIEIKDNNLIKNECMIKTKSTIDTSFREDIVLFEEKK